MKKLMAAVLLAGFVGSLAGAADAYPHHHRHRVCFVRHHHRVCTWR